MAFYRINVIEVDIRIWLSFNGSIYAFKVDTNHFCNIVTDVPVSTTREYGECKVAEYTSEQ